MSNHYRVFLRSCLSLLLASWLPQIAVAETSDVFELDDDVAIEIRHFGRQAEVGIIWFACNQGDDAIEFSTARKLARRGYQLYFPDMLSAHFLSPLPSNIARVPGTEVAGVVEYILQTTSAERIYLVAGARSAVVVLRGLADARLQQPGSKLGGALLITPRINRKTPEPGAEPEYINEAGLSLHPLRILEGERTPNRWGLEHLRAALSKSGSAVSVDLIKGVRGYFYLRDEQTEAESEMTRNLDRLIHENLGKIESP